MASKITTITTRFMLNVFVNCYLVNTGDGYVLIDTGKPNKRKAIEQEMESAGCRPGSLKLIVLTHGDVDHCGNAAYLAKKFGAKIAMHQADLGMVEDGDFFASRKKRNALMSAIMNFMLGISAPNRFTPDIFVEEGDDFSAYGFDAQVVHLPGHAGGNIGLLTRDGDLFCGDLLGNLGKPEVWSLVDDEAAMNASVEKLKGLDIRTVYPGHGESFTWEAFAQANL